MNLEKIENAINEIKRILQKEKDPIQIENFKRDLEKAQELKQNYEELLRQAQKQGYKPESEKQEAKQLEQQQTKFNNEYERDENKELGATYNYGQEPNKELDKTQNPMNQLPVSPEKAKEDVTKPESRKKIYPDPHNDYYHDMLDTLEQRVGNIRDAEILLFNRPNVGDFMSYNRKLFEEKQNQEKNGPLIPNNNWDNPNAIGFLKENDVNYVSYALEFETPF